MQNKISFSYSYILTMWGILVTFDCIFAPIPRAPGLSISVGRAPAVAPQLSLKSIILGICGGWKQEEVGVMYPYAECHPYMCVWRERKSVVYGHGVNLSE